MIRAFVLLLVGGMLAECDTPRYDCATRVPFPPDATPEPGAMVLEGRCLCTKAYAYACADNCRGCEVGE